MNFDKYVAYFSKGTYHLWSREFTRTLGVMTGDGKYLGNPHFILKEIKSVALNTLSLKSKLEL